MKLLVDTQTYLWWLLKPERLSTPVTESLSDTGNEAFVSSASSWEIAIKYRLGKLPLPQQPEIFIPESLWKAGMSPLPIQHSHALRVAALPMHHKDPFDRILIAQAQLEDLTIVTADAVFAHYEVNVLRSI